WRGPRLADRTVQSAMRASTGATRRTSTLFFGRGGSRRSSIAATFGLPWVRGLEKALNAAKAAVILIGPHGLGNTQHYERDLAIIRQTREASFPIVPVILPGAQVERPFNFLQVLTWIDFSRVAKVSEAPAELDRLVAAVGGAQTSSADAIR